MDVATVIRVARRKAGLSQRKLAQDMRVAASAVAQWETGVTLPTLEKRVDLSERLGIPFSDLLPEAEGLTPTSLEGKDVLALVQKLLALPPSVREAMLMQAASIEEALRKAPAVPQGD